MSVNGRLNTAAVDKKTWAAFCTHLILHTAALLGAARRRQWRMASSGCTLCVIALRGGVHRGASCPCSAHILYALGCIHQLNALFHKCREMQWSILDSAKRVHCAVRAAIAASISLAVYVHARSHNQLRCTLNYLHSIWLVLLQRTSIIYYIPSFPAAKRAFCSFVKVHISLSVRFYSYQPSASKLEMPFIEIQR